MRFTIGGNNVHRYYSTQRPVMPGGFPKRGNVEKIHNFESKIFCEEIGNEAWGYIDYTEPLTKEESDGYELTPAGMKTYWCVTSSVYDSGRITAAITNVVQAVKKPDYKFKSTRRKDIYNDWFESQEEAERFVAEALNA